MIPFSGGIQSRTGREKESEIFASWQGNYPCSLHMDLGLYTTWQQACGSALSICTLYKPGAQTHSSLLDLQRPSLVWLPTLLFLPRIVVGAKFCGQMPFLAPTTVISCGPSLCHIEPTRQQACGALLETPTLAFAQPRAAHKAVGATLDPAGCKARISQAEASRS